MTAIDHAALLRLAIEDAMDPRAQANAHRDLAELVRRQDATDKANFELTRKVAELAAELERERAFKADVARQRDVLREAIHAAGAVCETALKEVHRITLGVE